jgi:hypothetical protein
MTDKLIAALRYAIATCEDPKHRTHHTLQQQCRFLDGLRAELLPALEEAEKQQAAAVSFDFEDRSVMVSQEAYSIFLDREKAAQAEPTGRCAIEVVNGPEGPSLYIGDDSSGHRLAGAKPWGGGRTVFKFDVAIGELVREAKALASREAFPCWSCKEPVTLDERGDADGNCPHCNAELDLETWPHKEA